MKIVSWNVNGIRACLKRNSLDPIWHDVKPDIFCIQETKAHPDQVDLILKEYEHHFWNSSIRPGYAGTAVFSKIKPKSVAYGIDIKDHDQEGRVIAVEFDTFYLVNVYVPNSGRGLPRLTYRSQWDKDFLLYLKKLEKNKPVILCGDLNVAHKEIDLSNPKSNYNKTAGFTQLEIDSMDNIIKAGFIDTFREFHKEGGHYTYWGAWNNLRERNIGWRIDYFIISPALKKRIDDSFILPKILGSDHCPVGIIIKE